MKLIRWSGMVAGMVALLAGCSELTGITGREMDLERARRLWDARGVDDYTMRVRLMGAWFGGVAVIQVRNGVPVSVEPQDGYGTGGAELWSRYDTVEELFGVLEYAAQEDADHVQATFHERYGLPVEVSIDFSERAADDEFGFLVETFDRR